MRNWSGHVEFAALDHVRPTSVAEVQSLVASTPRVRALGTAHSFNDLADTSGVHLSLEHLPQDLEIDTEARVARVPAAMRYGEAARLLDARGWAVHNMASLGHISVAGTIATGTHGSGDRNPTLSATVVGLDLVTASGEVLHLSPATHPATFAGSVVALGALGVVTHVHLRIEPAFEVRQYVFDGISHAALLDGFDSTFGSAYSVSFFTPWSPSLTGQVWMKRRADQDGEWAGGDLLDGRQADVKRHPLPDHDAVHCTEQLGAVGPWHERLPHFKLDFTPSSGDELQTEYLVPRSEAVGLLQTLEQWAPRIHPILHVSEIRTMCADDLWLSGAYGRDTVGIHFTWQRRPEVLEILADLDGVFRDHGGRPHWGKLYDAPWASIAARYPRFGDFAALAQDMDPTGKFRNATLDGLLASD